MISPATRFLKDIVPIFGIRGVALLVSFSLSVLLARGLGPDAYGAYVFAIALFTIIQPIAGGGLGTLVVRELAQPELNRSAKARLTGRYLVIAAGISITVAVVSAFIFFIFFGSERPILALAVVVLPAVVLIEMARGAMIGQHRVRMGQFISELAMPGLFMLLLAGMFLIPSLSVGAGGALLAFAMAGWIIMLVFLQSDGVFLPRAWSDIPKLPEIGIILRKSLPFAMLEAAHYLNSRIDIIAIGHYMAGSDVSHYQVAAKIASFVSMPAALVGVLMAPRFAEAFQGQSFGRLRRLYWSAQVASLVLSVPAFLLLLFGGSWLVVTVFGPSYAPATAPLLVLVLVQMLMSLRWSSSTLMTMSGQEGTVMRAILIGAVANIALNALLIPQFGTVGAATATAIASCLTFTILAISLYRSRLLARGP